MPSISRHEQGRVEQLRVRASHREEARVAAVLVVPYIQFREVGYAVAAQAQYAGLSHRAEQSPVRVVVCRAVVEVGLDVLVPPRHVYDGYAVEGQYLFAVLQHLPRALQFHRGQCPLVCRVYRMRYEERLVGRLQQPRGGIVHHRFQVRKHRGVVEYLRRFRGLRVRGVYAAFHELPRVRGALRHYLFPEAVNQVEIRLVHSVRQSAVVGGVGDVLVPEPREAVQELRERTHEHVGAEVGYVSLGQVCLARPVRERVSPYRRFQILVALLHVHFPCHGFPFELPACGIVALRRGVAALVGNAHQAALAHEAHAGVHLDVFVDGEYLAVVFQLQEAFPYKFAYRGYFHPVEVEVFQKVKHGGLLSCMQPSSAP